MDSYKEYQKRYIVQKIKRDKKEFTKDTALLAASALVVGLGVLGTAVFGDDLINSFISNNKLTFASYMHIRFQEFLVALPIAGIFGGIIWTIANVRQVLKSYNTLKKDRIELDKVEEQENTDKKIR